VRPAVVLGALALAASPAAAAPLELGASLSATVNGLLQVATPAPRAAAPAAPSVPVSPTALGVRLRLPIADVQLSTDPLGSGPLLAVGGDVTLGEVASVSLGARADVDLVAPPPAGTPPVGDGGAAAGGPAPGAGTPSAPSSPAAPAAPAPPSAPARRPAQDPAGSAPAAPPASAPATPGAGAAPDATAAPPASAPERSSGASGPPAARLAASASAAAPASAAGPPPAVAADTRQPAPAASPRAVDRVVEVAIAVVRSPWLIVGVILAALAYVLGQRMLDRSSKKLSHPGRSGAPDDELIEL
jgi:hypothetical protein